MSQSILVSNAFRVNFPMFLLWLRVAAVLYAAASFAVFPTVLYGLTRWRKICTHLAGLALFFHSVSVVEMLIQAHRWMPVGVREVESLLGLAVAALFFVVWWLYDAVSLGIFALPADRRQASQPGCQVCAEWSSANSRTESCAVPGGLDSLFNSTHR